MDLSRLFIACKLGWHFCLISFYDVVFRMGQRTKWVEFAEPNVARAQTVTSHRPANESQQGLFGCRRVATRWPRWRPRWHSPSGVGARGWARAPAGLGGSISKRSPKQLGSKGVRDGYRWMLAGTRNSCARAHALAHSKSPCRTPHVRCTHTRHPARCTREHPHPRALAAVCHTMGGPEGRCRRKKK
jgi:hypothetical protein